MAIPSCPLLSGLVQNKGLCSDKDENAYYDTLFQSYKVTVSKLMLDQPPTSVFIDNIDYMALSVIVTASSVTYLNVSSIVYLYRS